MAAKKDQKAFQKLKSDLANGTVAPLYVFYGEESYLKEYYRDAVIKCAVGDGLPDFNITELSERQTTPDTLTDAVTGLPFVADKKVVIVQDYPVMRASGAMKDTLTSLLENLPDTVCLIFYFDAQEFKPDKRLALVQGDYFALDLGEALYDAVVSFETLHHFSASKKAGLFRQIHRCLKPGGIYLECDYIAVSQAIEDLAFAECARRRRRDGIPDGVFVHFDTPLTLEHELQALRDGGFSRVEVVGFLPEDDHTPMLRAVKQP